MTTPAEDMKIGRRTAGGALFVLNMGPGRGPTLVRRAQTHRDEFKRRGKFHGLDRLDENLLKDAGLFREHRPGGATRVRRR